MDGSNGTGVKAETTSKMPNNWRGSRPPASARCAVPALEVERYIVMACSLALMVLLVVAMAGYAGIRGILSPTIKAVRATPVEDRNREADPDSLVTPDSVALGLIAMLSIVVCIESVANQSLRRFGQLEHSTSSVPTFESSGSTPGHFSFGHKTPPRDCRTRTAVLTTCLQVSFAGVWR
jgi:hypothetical protein